MHMGAPRHGTEQIVAIDTALISPCSQQRPLSQEEGDWVAIALGNDLVQLLLWNRGIHSLENDHGPTIYWQTRRVVSPETLILDADNNNKDVSVSNVDNLRLWVGGQNEDKTGKLVAFELDTEALEVHRIMTGIDNEDGFCWESASESTTSGSKSDDDDDGNDDRLVEPVIDVAVSGGPLFALAKQDRRIAAVAGKSIFVWDCVYDMTECTLELKVPQQKVISTGHTLYAVAMSRDGMLAAAGSGENIMIWDMDDSWTLLSSIPVADTSIRNCCLETDCIMSLSWIPTERGALLSGGYNGRVSLWNLSFRIVAT